MNISKNRNASKKLSDLKLRTIKESVFQVLLYETAAGQCPFEAFFDGLNPSAQKKLLANIDILSQLGNAARPPLSKKIEDNLFELRMKGPNIRVLYFFDGSKIIVLTHAFIKKVQKLPRKEIENAKRRRDDYLRRRDNEKLR